MQAAFAEQQAEIAAGLEDLGAFGLGRLFRGAVLDQLDAEHQAFAAHVADDVVFFFQLLQSGEKDGCPSRASWPAAFRAR